jgi:hypothetical protein
MNNIKIMVNGLPGNMAFNIARHALADSRFELITHSLTGPEITETQTIIDSVSIRLIQPKDRDQAVSAIKEKEGPFLSVLVPLWRKEKSFATKSPKFTTNELFPSQSIRFLGILCF